MIDTNTIVQVVEEAQTSLVRINWTMVFIAIVQSLGLVMSARITRVTRIILKDVNSDRTARIKEVEELNRKLTVLEKINSVLKERESPK